MSALLNPGRDGAILAAVIRSSLDCIIVVDEDSRVVEFNPASERAFGYARAFVLGKPIGELIVPPHLRRAHSDGFRRYLHGGEAHVLGRRVEIEAMRADGTILPVELTITEVLACDRRLFTASLRDLSERHAVENGLRGSEARLAAFFDHVPNTMYLKDADGRFIMANAEMARRLHSPAGALIGLRGADAMPSEIVAVTDRIEHEVRATGHAVSVEQAYPLPDGSVIQTVVMRFPVPDAEGRMTNVGAIFTNLTPQKEAEIAMRASEARLAAFMAYAPIGMYLKDDAGKVVLANAEMRHAFPEMRRAWGQEDPADPIGRETSELFDARTAAAIDAQEAGILAADRPRTDEWHRPHLDRYGWAETVRFPVHRGGCRRRSAAS